MTYQLGRVEFPPQPRSVAPQPCQCGCHRPTVRIAGPEIEADIRAPAVMERVVNRLWRTHPDLVRVEGY